MKKSRNIVIVLLLPLLLVLAGYFSQEKSQEASKTTLEMQENSNEEKLSAAEQSEVATIRWGVVGQYDYVDDDEPWFVDSKRASKVNAVLKEKGYDFQIELIYFGEREVGDQLQIAVEQEQAFDIITFDVAGTGAEDMAAHLVPLEEYMDEGEILHDVYQIYSEEIWKANQVDGHSYNIGQLTGAIAPTYYFQTLTGREEPDYPEEAIIEGDEEKIAQYLKEYGGYFFLPSFQNRWEDQIFAEYQFHMIAPGIGLNVEEGVEFENIWESEYAQRWIESGLEKVKEGIVDVYWGPKTDYLGVEREVGALNVAKVKQVDMEDHIWYMHYFPCTSKSRMSPLLEQCYTSVMKNSKQLESCLTLLAVLNTDPELCQSMYEEPSRGYEENPTGEFSYLCNYYIATDETDGAQTQNERVAALTDEELSPILGFTFDRTAVEKEVQALETVYEQMWENVEWTIVDDQLIIKEKSFSDRLVEALEDPEKYNEVLLEGWQEKYEKYKQALKDAGIDKVIEEANRQLEQWRAKQ